MKRRHPPLMSHADRQRLIQAPFTSQLVARKSWGGTYSGHAGSVQEMGQRTWRVSPEDESYIHYMHYGRWEDE